MTRLFTVRFECETAVFDDDLHEAICGALIHTAAKVKAGNLHGLVRDDNGNTIGQYDLRQSRQRKVA